LTRLHAQCRVDLGKFLADRAGRKRQLYGQSVLAGQRDHLLQRRGNPANPERQGSQRGHVHAAFFSF
jgi:hypothetical protein